MLQEFDLPRGVTVIGRSADCQFTIEDPLVSRRHARLVVGDDGVQVEDLSSRNGVRVNGLPVRSPTLLRNGDRVRIGTQELVFSQVDVAARVQARTTGHLRLCANCRQPYPREMVACPACEATEQTDEDTLTAAGAAPHRWSVQLFIEALERALRLGRFADAERLARRATTQVEEIIKAGVTVDADSLLALASLAIETTTASDNAMFAAWALEIYGLSGGVPPLEVCKRAAAVGEPHHACVAGAASRVLERFGTNLPNGPGDAEGIARLRSLAGLAAQPDPAQAGASDGAVRNPIAEFGGVPAFSADELG